MNSMNSINNVSSNTIIEELKIEPALEPSIELENIKINDIDILMNKIPMSSGSKKTTAKVKSNVKNEVIENKEKNTPSTQSTPSIPSIPSTQSTPIATNDTEELLPIGKYKLEDLQRLSILNKIDTRKMGTAGNKINKLKAELYSELSEKKTKLII